MLKLWIPILSFFQTFERECFSFPSFSFFNKNYTRYQNAHLPHRCRRLDEKLAIPMMGLQNGGKQATRIDEIVCIQLDIVFRLAKLSSL